MNDRKHRLTLRTFIAATVAAMTIAAPAAAKELDALEAQLDLAWPREHVRVEGADFWIGETGPTGPIFSGPQQPVFICTPFSRASATRWSTTRSAGASWSSIPPGFQRAASPAGAKTAA